MRRWDRLQALSRRPRQATFAILRQERRPRPKPRPWAESIERDFGHNPPPRPHGQKNEMGTTASAEGILLIRPSKGCLTWPQSQDEIPASACCPA